MSIIWDQVVRVEPALWARIGRDSNGELHLMNGAEDDVQMMEGVHYWRLQGRWFVQEGGLAHYSDNEQDVFGPKPVFVEVHANFDDMVHKIESVGVTH